MWYSNFKIDEEKLINFLSFLERLHYALAVLILLFLITHSHSLDTWNFNIFLFFFSLSLYLFFSVTFVVKNASCNAKARLLTW